MLVKLELSWERPIASDSSLPRTIGEEAHEDTGVEESSVRVN